MSQFSWLAVINELKKFVFFEPVKEGEMDIGNIITTILTITYLDFQETNTNFSVSLQIDRSNNYYSFYRAQCPHCDEFGADLEFRLPNHDTSRPSLLIVTFNNPTTRIDFVRQLINAEPSSIQPIMSDPPRTSVTYDLRNGPISFNFVGNTDQRLRSISITR